MENTLVYVYNDEPASGILSSQDLNHDGNNPKFG